MSLLRYSRIALPNFALCLDKSMVFVVSFWLLAFSVTLVMAFISRYGSATWQNAWLMTSLPLTAGSVAVITSQARQLTYSHFSQTVPGWRLGNLAVAITAVTALLLAPYVVGEIIASFKNQPWQIKPFLWFSLATLFGFLCGLLFRQLQGALLVFVAGIQVLIVAFIALTPQKIQPADFLWKLVVNAVLRPTESIVFGLMVVSVALVFAVRRWPMGLASRIISAPTKFFWSRPQWLSKQRWPLIFSEAPMYIWIASATNALIAVHLVSGNINYTNDDAHYHFLLWFSITIAGQLQQFRFARTAGMLMWLPYGLAREPLGVFVFKFHATIMLCAGVIFMACVHIFGGVILGLRLEDNPQWFLVLIGYTVFSAGLVAAAYRVSYGEVMRATLTMLPLLVFCLLALVRYGIKTAGWDLSDYTLSAVAAVLATLGYLLGTRFTTHWGQQDIASLLRPAKL